MTGILHDASFMQLQFIALFKDIIQTSKLERRIIDLDSAPELIENNGGYSIEFSDGTDFMVDATVLNIAQITDGLCTLYGFGYIKPTYNSSAFSQIDQRKLEVAYRLSAEIWDRRIHLEWMQKRKHDAHN